MRPVRADGATLAADFAAVNGIFRLDRLFVPRYRLPMKTPREILAHIGHAAAAEALGVTPARIDRATRDERLPAAWLDTLELLARRPLPREAFAFKRAGEAA